MQLVNFRRESKKRKTVQIAKTLGHAGEDGKGLTELGEHNTRSQYMLEFFNLKINL
jgi:hypothetical protein